MSDGPVPLAHLPCPRHKRWNPPPGVILTIPRTSWRNCKDCRTVWREGMGPAARREAPPMQLPAVRPERRQGRV